MNTMLHWSPTRQFHLHHEADDLFERFFYGTRDEAAQRAPLLPAVEGRIEDGTYVMQFSLAGVDPKDVAVSLMDNVLTVKGERKADHDSTGKDYFVREVAYGAFQRSFALPHGCAQPSRRDGAEPPRAVPLHELGRIYRKSRRGWGVREFEATVQLAACDFRTGVHVEDTSLVRCTHAHESCIERVQRSASRS